FIPENNTFVSGSWNNSQQVWDMASGQIVHTYNAKTSVVSSATISVDNRYRLAGDDKNNLNLWDVISGTRLRTFTGHKGVIQCVAFSADGRTAVSGSDDKTLKLWEIETGRELLTFAGHTDLVSSVAFTPDGKLILSASGDNSIIIWSVATGKWIAKLYSFNDGTWAIIDSDGRFDSSNGGDVKGLHWVVNNEPLEFKQLKNRYYEPGLLSKVMGHNNGKLRNIEAFTSVNLFPQVKVIPPANSLNTINISLTNRGGGIGKVRVLINGKEISSDARGAKPDPNARAANIQLEIPEALLIANEENSIQVLAWNKEDYLSSRGELVKFALPTTKKAEPPTLHAIVIGTSRYADSKLNLTYSGKDATDIATAISISAKRLFGSDKVKLKLLTDDTTRLDAILPTRDNIVQSFADATKAASSDILVIYMAGHGVMAGNGEDEDYYYLTQEARSSDLSDPAIRKQYGIASAELTEWIKKIPALKQVMILDTCAAGGAAAKLVDKREFSFDQTRSLERLKDRTGFHILMGAAANKQSLEASRFGQGLLTYALLQGVKGAALRNDQSVDVQKIFQYAVDEVPKLAGSVGGIQRPQIASPLGSSFDIGLLTTSDKLLIPLATVKPMILRATFQDKEEGDDTLLLSKQINSLLREQAARLRGSQLVYVDADELPGAWRMTGLYQQSGDNVTVRVLMKEGKTKKNFSVHGKVDDIQGLADIIMAQAQEMLGN
ncbi:MAG: caspase family protein, partial [Geobacteraceae bacterium]|nr:caspase family protein [Geobacteraceae bacterium]